MTSGPVTLAPFSDHVPGITYVALEAVLTVAPEAPWSRVLQELSTWGTDDTPHYCAPTRERTLHLVREHLRASVAALANHFGHATPVRACWTAMPPAPKMDCWEAPNTASISAQRWSWLAPRERRRDAGMTATDPMRRQCTMLQLRPRATRTRGDAAASEAGLFTAVGFHLGNSDDLRRDPVMFPIQDAWRVLQHLAPDASWGWHAGRLAAHNTRATAKARVPACLTPILTGEGWLYPIPLDRPAWEVVDLDALRRREAMAATFATLPPLDDDL